MNHHPPRHRALALALLPLVALTACGGDDDTAAAAPAAADTTAATDPETTPPAPSAAPTSDTAAAPTDIDWVGVTITVGEVNQGISSALTAAGLADTPYEVEYISAESTSVTLEGVNAGDIDLFSAGEPPAVFGAAAGNPFKVIATYYKPFRSNAVIVPGDSDIEAVADLAGRTVATNQGTTAHKVLWRALDEVGLTLDDIELVNLQPAEAFAAFTSGQIDAWATFDPHLIIADQQYGARVLVDGDNGRHSGVLFLAARNGALEDEGKVAALGDLLGRIRAAQAWAHEPANRETYLTLQSELNGQTIEINGGVYDRGSEDWRPIDDTIIADTQRTADEFEALGLAPSVDVSGYFDLRFNDVLYGEG